MQEHNDVCSGDTVPSKNLQQFSNTIVTLSFVNKTAQTIHTSIHQLHNHISTAQQKQAILSSLQECDMVKIKFKLEAINVLPNINCITACRPPKGPKNVVFVPDYLDLWPSNSSKQGTKHVFRTNLVQICSAVPEIFHTQTKKNHRLTAPKTEPSAVHCVR